MKFQAVDEMKHFSFDDSGIRELQISGGNAVFTLTGATVKAKNSQNARYQDMYCGELVLQLEHIQVARLVKEGMKYYDADGRLLREVPDEDIPAPAQAAVIHRLSGGTIFTTVEDEAPSGYAYEFGIDVPQEQDEDEVDTFWLCLYFEHSIAMWDRYCSPSEAE